MQKAKAAGQNTYLAILEHCNTPSQGVKPCSETNQSTVSPRLSVALLGLVSDVLRFHLELVSLQSGRVVISDVLIHTTHILYGGDTTSIYGADTTSKKAPVSRYQISAMEWQKKVCCMARPHYLKDFTQQLLLENGSH